jgi:hypothetical protein
MKKTFTIVGILLALLSTPSLAHYRVSAHKPKAGKRSSGSVPGPSATIIFRGLMVFHPDPAREYFEVGILPAPEHEFRVQVIENSPKGVSSFFVPLGQFSNLKHDLWSLEFAHRSRKGIGFYQNGFFDRKSDVGDDKDFRWVLDLEGKEFYDRELPTKTSQLGPVLHITGGEFYTNRKTPSLIRKKGDGTFQYFGSAAEEVAAGFSLKDGDIVLKSEKSGTEFLRLKQKPDTTYEIVIENALVREQHMAAILNHFQYFYRLIAEPTSEWYGFDVASAVSLADELPRGANFRLANYVAPVAPRPALCGQVLLSKREKSLR